MADNNIVFALCAVEVSLSAIGLHSWDKDCGADDRRENGFPVARPVRT